jgi:hypothetical protein
VRIGSKSQPFVEQFVDLTARRLDAMLADRPVHRRQQARLGASMVSLRLPPINLPTGKNRFQLVGKHGWVLAVTTWVHWGAILE